MSNKIKRLHIRASVYDCFLYMDHLFVIWEDNTLRYINTDNILGEIVNKYSMSRDIIESTFIKTPKSTKYINKELFILNWKNSIDEYFIELSPHRFDVLTALPNEPILDFLVYCERVYIANRDGLYEIILNFNKNGIDIVKPLSKVFGSKTIHLSAKTGNLLISTSKDGLFNSSLWESSPNIKVYHEMIEKESLKAIWTGVDFINYNNNVEFQYYDNEDRRVEKGEDTFSNKSKMTGQRRIVRIGKNVHRSEELLVDTDSKPILIFNNNRYIFLVYKNGLLSQRSLNQRFGHEDILSKNETEILRIDFKGESPLDSYSVMNGIVLEYFDRIDLLTDKLVYNLSEKEAYTVRTFPRSFHYRNLVAISNEDGLEISSISPFKEHEIS